MKHEELVLHHEELKKLYREVDHASLQVEDGVAWLLRPGESASGMLQLGPFQIDPRKFLDLSSPHVLTRRMNTQEFNALKLSVAAHGVEEAVVLDRSGRVIDGHHRLKACAELILEGIGVGTIPYRIVEFESAREEKLFVVLRNALRRHMTTKDKEKMAAVLLEEGHDGTDALIAQIAGILSAETVREIRVTLEAQGRVPKLLYRVDPRGHKHQRRDDGNSCAPVRHRRERVPAKNPNDEHRNDQDLMTVSAGPVPAYLGITRARNVPEASMTLITSALWNVLPVWWGRHGVGVITVSDLISLCVDAGFVDPSQRNRSVEGAFGIVLNALQERTVGNFTLRAYRPGNANRRVYQLLPVNWTIHGPVM